MNRSRPTRFISAFIIWLFAALVYTSSAQMLVQQWHPVDLSFSSTTAYANPFTGVTISAKFTGPGNTTLVVPGFYVGDSIWKIRFAPTKTGTWTYATSSNDANLNAVTGNITCIANTQSNIHGRLLVDSLNPHHFRYEDGTPYFLIGGEIDWLGLIQCGDTTIAKPKQIIDMYTARGFTMINLNGYAWDTSWKPGNTSADDFGPPDMYAWGGTYAAPDQTRLNTAFWGHFDRVIDYLFQKGMVAYIYFKVYNKGVTWPSDGSTDDSLYFSTIVARYQAYPNIIWSFSKEAYYETNQSYIHTMLNLIGSKDAYKRLRTLHDDIGTGTTPDYAAEPSLDTNINFRTSQLHSQQPNLYAVTLSQRSEKNWPVYNAESGYEIGNDGGSTYSVVQSKGEVLKRIYKVFMAGAYSAFYYTYHAWDVVRTYEEPNGLIFYQYLTGFFENTDWYSLVPSDNLITADTANHCLAKPGSEYIVYFSNGGSTKLTIAGATGTLQGTWMNGYTGVQQPAGAFANGSQQLTSPWNDTTPALLWLHSATGNMPSPVSRSRGIPCKIENGTMEVQLDRAETVRIDIFSLSGSHEATIYAGQLAAGRHVIALKKNLIPPGTFLIALTEGNTIFRLRACFQ